MVLSFKTKFPDGTPTDFVRKILDGQKIHTLRAGTRWWSGDKIHMATGVRSSNYDQFNVARPDLQKVVAVQAFQFSADKNERLVLVLSNSKLPFIHAEDDLANLIGRNDGFANGVDFFNWFMPKDRKGRIKKLPADYEVNGQIIHWTSLKY